LHTGGSRNTCRDFGWQQFSGLGVVCRAERGVVHHTVVIASLRASGGHVMLVMLAGLEGQHPGSFGSCAVDSLRGANVRACGCVECWYAAASLLGCWVSALVCTRGVSYTRAVCRRHVTECGCRSGGLALNFVLGCTGCHASCACHSWFAESRACCGCRASGETGWQAWHLRSHIIPPLVSSPVVSLLEAGCPRPRLIT
jgi:hypothetical protein